MKLSLRVCLTEMLQTEALKDLCNAMYIIR